MTSKSQLAHVRRSQRCRQPPFTLSLQSESPQFFSFPSLLCGDRGAWPFSEPANPNWVPPRILFSPGLPFPLPPSWNFFYASSSDSALHSGSALLFLRHDYPHFRADLSGMSPLSSGCFASLPLEEFTPLYVHGKPSPRPPSFFKEIQMHPPPSRPGER